MDNQNIEKLFRESFEHFEADVNPNMWSQVQSQIGTNPVPSTDGGASSSTVASVASGVSSGIIKVAAVIGIAGALAVGGYWLTGGNDTGQPVAVQQEKVIPEEALQVGAPSVTEMNLLDDTPALNDGKADQAKSVREERPASIPSQEAGSDATTSNNTDNHSNSDNKADEISAAPQREAVVSKPAATPVVKDYSAVTPEENESDQTNAVTTPEASINASVQHGVLPLLVRFSNRDVSAEKLTWDFGDGSELSNAASPFHTYNKAGNYDVILVVEGNNQSISRDTVHIVVKPNITMVIPNYFTPNGDGIHDAFKVEAENIEKFQCRITDRNGNLVHQLENINSLWDGRDKFGNAVMEGAYIYLIEYTTIDGYSDIEKGMIMLKR